MTATPRLTLNAGDLIRIDGKRGMGLVVRAETQVSEDRARGDSYSVDEFDIVKFDGNSSRGALVAPKVVSYYFNDGSMRSKGEGLDRHQVKIVGSAKLKIKVTTEYIFNSAKLA